MLHLRILLLLLLLLLLPPLMLLLLLLQGPSFVVQRGLPGSKVVTVGCWTSAELCAGVKLHGGHGLAAVSMPGNCNSRQGVQGVVWALHAQETCASVCCTWYVLTWLVQRGKHG
jgi:hypothetical protein